MSLQLSFGKQHAPRIGGGGGGGGGIGAMQTGGPAQLVPTPLKLPQ
jgi:hypothetical protein